MKRKLWKLPLYLICSSLLLFAIISLTLILPSDGISPLYITLLCATILLSFVFFIVIGRLVRKTYSIKGAFLSTSIVVAFGASLYLLAMVCQITFHTDFIYDAFLLHNMTFFFMNTLLLLTVDSFLPFWAHDIIIILCPYLFLLFVKRSKKKSPMEMPEPTDPLQHDAN